VKAKFIGKPNGVYMKGAPCNYIHGQVYSIPYKFSQFPFWELLDPPPVLKVPAARVEDSVFESSIFVPPEMNDAPSGPSSSKPSVLPTVPPVMPVSGDGVKEPAINPVEALLESVKAKKVKGPGDEGYLRPLDIGGGFISIPAKVEEPFKDEAPDDEMPDDISYELRTMGEGIIGIGGEEKIERKKKVKKE
jgi:hypothetical protein